MRPAKAELREPLSHRRSRRRGGFTFVELCLGLLITSLVMAAMASFSLSMQQAWTGSDQSQALTLLANQAVARVQNHVRNARQLGAIRFGSLTSPVSHYGAAIMLWKDDTNGDGNIQGYEVEMVVHDVDSHQLLLYAAKQGDATTPWHWTTFTDPAVCDQFMVGRTATVLARNVYGAQFAKSGTTDVAAYPSLQFALKLTGDGSSLSGGDASRLLVQYGAASIRAPLTPPTY